MFEIIPNWHPIFVHYSIAAPTMALLLYIVIRIFPDRPFTAGMVSAARWMLWLGAIITVATVVAGYQAFDTVAHNAESHDAMVEHRNLARIAALSLWLIAIWSAINTRLNRRDGVEFLTALVVVCGLFGFAGWKGGELVYRYGTGVIPMESVLNPPPAAPLIDSQPQLQEQQEDQEQDDGHGHSHEH